MTDALKQEVLYFTLLGVRAAVRQTAQARQCIATAQVLS